MKCIICGRTIKKSEPHTYTFVYNKGRSRKVYGCSTCNTPDKFDAWLDALPTDELDRPIDQRVKSC